MHLALLFGAILFGFACNFTNRSSPGTPTGPGNPSTSAAITVQAQLTRGAASQEISATQTPEPGSLPPATPEPVMVTDTQTPPETCGESLPTRLSIGAEATVVVFQVTLRAGPGLTSEQVNYLARDRTIQVLQGPECIDGNWWWQVKNEELGYEGWMVEGDNENYYLEP